MAHLMILARRDIGFWSAIVIVASMLPAAGCARPVGRMTVWAAGPMTTITADTPAERVAGLSQSGVYDSAAETVRLAAAANETVGFQVIVDADSGDVGDLEIRITDLTGSRGRSIPAGAIRVWRMWPVEVREYPAWYLRMSERAARAATFYDALIPLDAPTHGAPFDLSAGERLALWVDVAVGRDARADEYLGAIELTGRVRPAGESASAWVTRRLKLALRVRDLVLPDTRAVSVLGWFDHRELYARLFERDGRPFKPIWLDRSDPLVARGLVVIRQLMKTARAHGLDLFDTAARPAMKRSADGRVRLDWTDYDAVVKPYLDGSAFADGIGCTAWPAPVDDSWLDPARLGDRGDTAHGATADQVIAQTAEHFERMGYGDRLFFWPIRGGGAGQYAEFAAVARRIRRWAPTVSILSELPGTPQARISGSPPDDYADLVDIMAPPGRLLDIRAQDALKNSDPNKQLAGVYLVAGDPPFTPAMDVFAPAADVRALPWLAMRAKLTGVLVGDVLAAGGLFYPGRFAGLEQALGSVRLKRLRAGCRDAARLRLLARRGREAVADKILSAMARYVGLAAVADAASDPLDARLDGWAGDGAGWRLAGQLLAAEALKAVHSDNDSSVQAIRARLAWRRFEESGLARAVRIERLAGRIRPIEGDRLRVAISAELFNERSSPARVAIALTKGPREYVPVKGEATPSTLAGGARRAAELIFECPHLPAGPTGKLDVPLRVAVQPGASRTEWAQVAMITSKAAPGAITVDGDLSDWPLSSANVAGEFRLLGRRGWARGPDGRARRQSSVFVLHDSQALYLGFRCRLPADATLVARPSNTIGYDQWLAMGEDMVEVVLDPNHAARGAGDLYRLVVKANGVSVAQKGVPGTPSVAPVAGWAAAAKVAVSRQADAWFVEIAIPRWSFGPNGGASEWGVNFIRYDTGAAEASSWVHAPRHYYDRRGLGTLLMESE